MFASYAGVTDAVTVANGTAALHLAYLACDIGQGDEVVLPALTFAGCAAMVLACGARPRFADCDPETLGLSADSVRSLITARTKAILAVHLFGNACEMDAILGIAERAGVRVIEDAAESLGTTYGGKHCGTLGDLGCFSFQAAKTVTTGEGGMVVTDDAALASKIRLLRNHGFRPGTHYWHDVVGFNYRLTNVQAAIGCAQLERLPEMLARRAHVKERYRAGLAHIPGVRVPRAPSTARPALWVQAVILDPDVFPQGRDGVRDALRARGIETRPLFHPVYWLPPYRDWASSCPNAERLSDQGLTLPVFERISDDEIAFVCGSLAQLAR